MSEDCQEVGFQTEVCMKGFFVFPVVKVAFCVPELVVDVFF